MCVSSMLCASAVSMRFAMTLADVLITLSFLSDGELARYLCCQHNSTLGLHPCEDGDDTVDTEDYIFLHGAFNYAYRFHICFAVLTHFAMALADFWITLSFLSVRNFPCLSYVLIMHYINLCLFVPLQVSSSPQMIVRY